MKLFGHFMIITGQRVVYLHSNRMPFSASSLHSSRSLRTLVNATAISRYIQTQLVRQTTVSDAYNVYALQHRDIRQNVLLFLSSFCR
ncbi:hypothetical protein ABKN59_003064 [Abortiporus biennis]